MYFYIIVQDFALKVNILNQILLQISKNLFGGKNDWILEKHTFPFVHLPLRKTVRTGFKSQNPYGILVKLEKYWFELLKFSHVYIVTCGESCSGSVDAAESHHFHHPGKSVKSPSP